MNVFEFTRKESLGDSEFPLSSVHAKLTLMLESKVDLPPAAAKKLALQQLRRLLEEADPEDLLSVANSEADLYSSSEDTSHDQVGHVVHRNGWIQPAGLDLRVVKSAHRMILEISRRGESGRQVLASDLVGAMGLSAPTIGRLLREGDPGNSYMSQYVRISPAGRTKALDLTSEGRMLASKIRAEAVPV